MIRNFTTCLIALGVVLCAHHTGFAQDPPKTALEILRRADYLNNQFDDQEMHWRMLVIGVDGDRQIIEFKILQKGADKRLIRFVAPGTMKGMAVLMRDRNNAYVYLRNMNKVRRVASHNMSQPFAGSDFTQDDMASTEYAKDYDVALEREDEQFWYIKGIPRENLNVEYEHVIITVSKANGWFNTMTFFDKEGAFRRLSSKRVRRWAGGAMKPQIITMEDLRTGHKSILQLLDFKVNQGVPDSNFTVRYLRWGR